MISKIDVFLLKTCCTIFSRYFILILNVKVRHFVLNVSRVIPSSIKCYHVGLSCEKRFSAFSEMFELLTTFQDKSIFTFPFAA